MRRNPSLVLLQLLLIAVLLSPTPALAAPIVFDLEDGTHGSGEFWNVARSDDPVLGGNYAMYGIDHGRMSIEMDLTAIRAISFDRLITGHEILAGLTCPTQAALVESGSIGALSVASQNG